MVVRDRGFQRRALARVGGPAVAEPNQREHDPAIASPVPGSASASHIAGDQTVIADRPRTLMSREVVELKHKLHDRMVREIDPSRMTADLAPDDAKRAVQDAVLELLAQEGVSLSRTDELTLMHDIADEIVGFGPIEPLLQDETVTEVMINRPDRVYYEREGVLHLSDRAFRDDDHIMRLIDKIVSPLGRRIDESSPMVDARLPDGSRVNAIIPPLAIQGPSLTIRKFAKRAYSDQDLVRFGTMSQAMCELLRACVWSRLNVLVSGGTGTGKTTFLNVLSSYISNRERIVSIEDPAELRLQQDNWVSLETRPPNIEGRGQVIQRDLVRNALRMRPDRIIVGECRAGEAFDMLQAMNTGHDGSMTTVHANTPRDALSRLEQMIGMSGIDIAPRSARAQIASAINVVIQVGRLSDGKRRLMSLSELIGMEGEVVTMQEIFRFRLTGRDEHGTVLGRFEASGIRPHFM